ncbi:MAG: GGDEF domain-containing protein [Lachnospiraceae bacterium]|nr:GGDEF domain-containing protein [Lachnospiraceae bacterium]
MKIFQTKENVFGHEDNNEYFANKYVIKCATTAIIILFIIWILNVLNIFVVDKKTTNICFVAAILSYVFGGIVLLFADLSKKWVKYYVLFWMEVIITIMTTAMTFHAILATLLTIICSSMYCSKKVLSYTYILTMISIVVTVFYGYCYGLCDTNMVLLSGEPLTEYIGENNEFLLTKINIYPLETLTLYFVLPRCMICASFVIVCKNISKIIMLNHNYAEKMKNLAEIDGMTGLYNKSIYLSMINGKYTSVKSVGVIFWDINSLKKINDTLGHETGDKLISTVATSIKNVTDSNGMSYRIGGDEFVMIISECGEEGVKKKISKWEEELSKVKKDLNFPIYVSVGYAVGEGENIADVINKADKMMYENKREWHSKEDKGEKTN